MPEQKKKSENIEIQLKKLTTIIDELEKNDIPLEESLKQFEEGIRLIKSCQHILDDAEQRIKKLTK